MTSPVKRRQFLKATGAGAAAVGLAGCTASDLSGGGGDSDGPIIIGATAPQTGQLSGLGEEIAQGYELGVSHINEDGGIGGREVELVLEDDGSEPRNARNELQNILDQQNATMLWGSVTSPMVTAGSSIAERSAIPFLGAGFAHEAPHEENDFEWTYVPYPKSRHIARGTRQLFDGIPEANRPSSVAIWQPNSGWGAEMASEWASSFSDGGYEIVLNRKFSTGSSDFSSLISETESVGAEVLLSNPIPPDGITAVKQMESSGYAPKGLMFVRASHSNGWWKALGKRGAYTATSPGWVPGLVGNGNERFRSSYAEEYDTGKLTTPVTVGGAYNLTQVAAQALEAAEDSTPEAVRSALRSETYNTIMGTFGLADNGVITDEKFDTPGGQWLGAKQRLVFPNTDSDLAMDFRYPMTPWNER
jgi:branched-chain amino acid transport system substrate-binding protein